MEYYVISNNLNFLKDIQNILFTLLSNDYILKYNRYKLLQEFDSWDKIKNNINDVDYILNDFISIAKFLNEELFIALKQLVGNDNFGEKLHWLFTEINKNLAKRQKNALIERFKNIMTKKYKDGIYKISNQSINIKDLYSKLSRILSLIVRLNENYTSRYLQDSEYFKPLSIDINIIINQIDIAKTEIQSNLNIPENFKKELISHIDNITLELKKNTPVWKNIIGALVITAALISGIADLPNAIKNINDAIKYIIGVSSTTKQLDHQYYEAKKYLDGSI
jgi:hypothetical protein